MAPEDIEVIYEDEWLLAVDKPAGLLVHGDGTGAVSLTGLMRERLMAAGDERSAAELQPVQRLDVDTTGVVLLSRRKEAQPKLDALVASHDGIAKRYLAIVRGEFPQGTTTISAPLARDRHDARRMRVAAGGKPSRSVVRRLAVTGARRERLSLVAVELKSGRKHQIRVHLASRGFPIVGDALYGTPADRAASSPASRRLPAYARPSNRHPVAGLMLHAYEEELAHPITGERLGITTSYPRRFTAYFPEGTDVMRMG